MAANSDYGVALLAGSLQPYASADLVGEEEGETTIAAIERSRSHGSNVENDLGATRADGSLLMPDIEKSEGVSQYHHTPLEDSSTQIRLLRLTSLTDTISDSDWIGKDEISCTIESFNLQDMRGKFNAISYTWGDQNHKRPILINSKTFWVSVSLWNLLREILMHPMPDPRMILSHYSGSCKITDQEFTHVWVDQLCIDQAQLDEQNHQVKLMSGIYIGAKHVIVCPDDHERSLYEFTPGIEQNKYWNRLWIIQEIMLAESLWVLYRGDLSTWHRVREEWIHYSRLPVPAIVHRKITPGIMKNNFALHRALELFSAQKCRDPRDKVYGLMGIVHEKERIEIDYNKEAPEVYWDAIAGLRTTKLKDPERIIELGREMGVTGGEEIGEEVTEKFRSLFGGRSPREVFQTTLI